MQTDADNLIEDKKTTQAAPLEKFLTHLRTRKIIPYVKDKMVLDFGCGSELRTLRAISSLPKARYGIDAAFKNEKANSTPDGITVVGSFSDLHRKLDQTGDQIEVILSLACFEHLEPLDLRQVMIELCKISSDTAIIVGTVPRPPAKPVLEFLSYKLGLIDRSQIEDHKVYYDKQSLRSAIDGTGWVMESYTTFQVGMNSFFKFVKQ